jgi:hypothetical protein
LAGLLRLNGAGKVWTASGVLPNLLHAAAELAARFDARNRNFHASDRLGGMLALVGADGQAASAVAAADVQREIAAVLAKGDTGRAADLLVAKARMLAEADLPAGAAADFFRAADAYRAAGLRVDGVLAELRGAQVMAGGLERPADAALILAALSQEVAALPGGASCEDRAALSAGIARELARLGRELGVDGAAAPGQTGSSAAPALWVW